MEGTGVRERMIQVEKGLLFACCLALFLANSFSGELGTGSMIPILLGAIITSGLLSLVDDARVQTALTAGFALLCCFLPAMTFFLPLIAHDMLGSWEETQAQESVAPRFSWQFFNLVGIVPVLLLFQVMEGSVAVSICILIPVALLLRIRRNELSALSVAHRRLRDTNREAQDRLRQRNQELMDRQDSDLHAATLTERNRIAREIHDSVGHLLSSALLQLGALLVQARGTRSEEGLGTLRETLTEAMNSIRASVHDLRDESVDLQAQLRLLTENFHFCPMRLDNGWSGDPGMKVKSAVIAICREALANIMRHSNATQGSILMREHPAFRQLIISDNGIVRKLPAGEGMGLANMEERVHALGGQFRISTTNGFEVFISIPKEEYHARTGGG